MRWQWSVVEFVRRERTPIILALVFALVFAGLRLLQERGSLDVDWGWYLIEALVCVIGGLCVGRWWSLAVPLVVEALLLPVERIFGPPFPDPYLVLLVAIGVGLHRAGATLVASRGHVTVGRVGFAGLLGYVASAVAVVALLVLPAGRDALVPALIAVGLVQLVAGFAIGRWPALLLPVLLVIFALPVPTDPDAYEPIPAWFVMAFWFAPLSAGILALGVGVRRLLGRWGPLR